MTPDPADHLFMQDLFDLLGAELADHIVDPFTSRTGAAPRPVVSALDVGGWGGRSSCREAPFARTSGAFRTADLAGRRSDGGARHGVIGARADSVAMPVERAA
jgi:hypothetical protein